MEETCIHAGILERPVHGSVDQLQLHRDLQHRLCHQTGCHHCHNGFGHGLGHRHGHGHRHRYRHCQHDHDDYEVDLVHSIVVRLIDWLRLVVVVFVVRTWTCMPNTLDSQFTRNENNHNIEFV